MVMQMNEKESITDKSLLYKSLFVLACVITSFIFAKELYLDNGTIALTGAAVLLLFYTFDIKGHEREDKVEEIFGMVDWTTIFFFVGLFVIVYGLEVTGVTNGKMADAGIRKGFIILKANGVPMKTVDDLEKAMKEARKSPEQGLFITGMFPSGKRAMYAVDLTQE